MPPNNPPFPPNQPPNLSPRKEIWTIEEAIADGITGIYTQEEWDKKMGKKPVAPTPEPRRSKRIFTPEELVIPARTRAEIIQSEQEGTLDQYLLRSIEQAAAVYESAGLNSWAQDVRRLQTQMSRISQADRAWMEARRQAGEIIFPMPGKQALASSYLSALQTLKPQATISGRRQIQQQETYLWDHVSGLASNALNGNSLTNNIPDHPYFSVFNSSEKTPDQSRSKTIDEQKSWVLAQAQIAVQSGKPPTSALAAVEPAEYVAAQTLWTAKGGEPFDSWGWNRFITVEPSSDGDVPHGYWDSGVGRMWFGVVGGRALGYAGVRLLGRILAQP